MRVLRRHEALRAIYATTPATGGKPAQHRGECVVAQLGSNSEPSHYFAVVSQEHLTLTPLAKRRHPASKSKKTYCERNPTKAAKSPKNMPSTTFTNDEPLSITTVASLETAIAVDHAVAMATKGLKKVAKLPRDVDAAEAWPLDDVVRVALADVVTISYSSFAVSKRAAANSDKRVSPYSLVCYTFADSAFETHSFLVQLTFFDNRPSIEFLTCEKDDTSLPGELVTAHFVSLVRSFQSLRPSYVLDPTRARDFLDVNRGASVHCYVADDTNATSWIRDLENAICDKNNSHKVESPRTSSSSRTWITHHHEDDRQLIDECRDVVRLLGELEADILVNVALKRALFCSPRLVVTFFTWLENLESNLDVLAEPSASIPSWMLPLDLEEDETFPTEREVQVALARRAIAGLRIVRASLHDRRGICECFEVFCMSRWPLARLVTLLASDHFNYSEQETDFDVVDKEKRHATSLGSPSGIGHRHGHLINVQLTPKKTAGMAGEKLRINDVTQLITQSPHRTKVSSHEFTDASVSPSPTNYDGESKKSDVESTFSSSSSVSSALFHAAAREEMSRKQRRNEKDHVAPHVGNTRKGRADDIVGPAKGATQMGDVDGFAAQKNNSDAHMPQKLNVHDASEHLVVGVSQKSYRPPFVKDSFSASAFADVRRAKLRPGNDDESVFAELLDAQLSVLLEFDELTAAWCRECDSVKTPHGDAIFPHCIVQLIVEGHDRDQARSLVQALFERSVGLILKLSFEKENQKKSDATKSSPESQPKMRSFFAAPVALLTTARLLVSLMRSSHTMRQIAASSCSDEIDDFLRYEHFYDGLVDKAITRRAAQLVQEATTLALQARRAGQEAFAR